MKKICITLLCLSSLISLAQSQIGMSPAYTITPVGATSTLIGTAYGDTISVTCYIKNTGGAVFNGLVTLYKRVDTLGISGSVRFHDSINVTNFNPNDSLKIVIVDTIKPAYYKQAGNGNTIVVWPYISGGLQGDSLHTVPVYVNVAAGIKELDIDHLVIFPNPVTQRLVIKPEQGIIYERISIYDIQSKKVADLKFTEEVDVHDLPAGTYWISVSTKTNKRFNARFVKTE